MQNNETNQQCTKCFTILSKGFTIVELVIVVLIVVIVGGAVIGRMLGGIEQSRLNAAGRQLVSHIRLAQERAKLEHKRYTVEFNATNETYAVYLAGGSFDGVDDYVSINYTNPVSATSVEAWFKKIGTPAGGYHIITGGSSVEISINDPGGYIRTGVVTDTLGRQVFNSGSGLLDSRWHHVAFTYDGAALRSYIDGSQTASNPVSGNLTGVAGEIGRYLSNTYVANGTISEVRIYDRALTASEISYSYNNKTPQSRAGLVGWWKLDEGQTAPSTGTGAALDSSGSGNNGNITGATWTQGVLGYLKDPAKNYQDINYDFDNLSEFSGVKISSVDFDGSTLTNSSSFNFDSQGRPKVGTENLTANGTIVLTIGSRTLTITVSRLTGEVTM